MALTAGQINPANYPQPDYSGVVRSAQIQSQELANIGANIGGAIKNFGEARKEQKKVDAYNKASSKAIESAITLGKEYNIAGVEETLRPFLDSYNDPSLSPIEKAALLDEGKAMIPNVFGRFDASKEAAIKMAQLDARGDRSVNLQQGEIIETINGQQYKVPITFNPATGERRRLDESLVGGEFVDPNAIDNALELPTNNETSGVSIDGKPGVLPPLVTPEIGSNVTYNPNDLAESIELGKNLFGRQNGLPAAPNVLPIAQEGATPTVTPSVAPPIVDGPPTNMAQKPSSVRLPPGAVAIEKPQERAITEEERKKLNLPSGQYIATFKGEDVSNIKQLETPPDSMEKLKENRMLKTDERVATVIESTGKGAERLVAMNEALSLLNSGEVKSGTLASYKVAALRLFGQDVASEEQFNSLVGNLAMEAIDLTKGAISDKEMAFFRQELAPGINKSVEGNKKILEFKIKVAERGLRINQMARDMLAKNALPSDIENAIKKMQEEDSLIPSNTSSTSSTPEKPMSPTERYKAKIKAK